MSSHSDLTIFDNLPYVPLFEICKHLDPIFLVTSPLRSENWKNAARQKVGRRQAVIFVGVSPENAQIGTVFSNEMTESVLMEFHAKEEVEDSTDFKVLRLHMRFAPENVKYLNVVISNSRRLANFESFFLEIFELMCFLFQPKVSCLYMNLDEFSFDTVNRLLLPLPPAKFLRLKIDGPHPTHDVKLKGSTVKKLLESSKKAFCIYIGGLMDEVFKSNQINVNVVQLTLRDARFLTHKNLLQMSFKDGDFGYNFMTSQCFKSYLTGWMKAKTGEVMSTVRCARFYLVQQQIVKLEEVLEGLNAKPWKYSARARSQYYYTDEGKVCLDMRDGFDIESVDGRIGTVHLTEEYFYFIVAEDRFEVRKYKQECFGRVVQAQRLLSHLQEKRDSLANAKASQFKMTRNKKKLAEKEKQDNKEAIEICKQRIAAAQAHYEEIQKLD